ncbi:MAG: hypothetical protein ACRDTG_09285 [Pseudonocardiaceae bacterium]
MATLHLDRLHCNTTEDNTGADDAYIKVNGDQVWGPFAINDGENLDIGVSVNFGDQAAIELWDEDSPDGDDILGRHVVRAGSGGQLKFNNDDSDYDLFYRTS